jgi:hypothetical protein
VIHLPCGLSSMNARGLLRIYPTRIARHAKGCERFTPPTREHIRNCEVVPNRRISNQRQEELRETKTTKQAREGDRTVRRAFSSRRVARICVTHAPGTSACLRPRNFHGALPVRSGQTQRQ